MAAATFESDVARGCDAAAAPGAGQAQDALHTVPEPAALEPAGAPTAVLSITDDVASWAGHDAVLSRERLLGPPPPVASGAVMQISDAVIMSNVAARTAYTQSAACDTDTLLRNAGAYATSACKAVQHRNGTVPACRLVVIGRLATGHSITAVLKGFRPGLFMRVLDAGAAGNPNRFAAALCQRLRVRQGTLRAAPRVLKNMRQINPGDLSPDELDDDGRPVRKPVQWMWVSAPEPDLVRRLAYLHDECVTMQYGKQVRVQVAEGNVSAAYQGLLAMGAAYDGFLRLGGVQHHTGACRAKEFHTDVEVSAVMSECTAWRSVDDAPTPALREGPQSFPMLVAAFDIEARSSRGAAMRREAEAKGVVADMDAFCDANRPDDTAFLTVTSFMWAYSVPRHAVTGARAGRLPRNAGVVDTVFLRVAACCTRVAPDPVDGVVTLHAPCEAVALHAVRDSWAVVHRPVMLMGYYSSGFDVKYLCRRAVVTGAQRFMFMSAHTMTQCEAAELEINSGQTGVASMTYWGDAPAVTAPASGGSYKRTYLASFGMTCVDMWWWLKNRYSFQTNGLNAVSKELLKVDTGKFDMPYALLYVASEGSARDGAKVVAYCARDSDLVLMLAAHVAMPTELMQSCRIMAVNAHDFMQQKQGIRLFRQLLREARARGYVMNTVPVTPPSEYEGGRVEEPVRGLYVKPVVVFDYASMYPSIMKLVNLCCSTHIEAVPAVVADDLPVPAAQVDAIAHALGIERDIAAAMTDLVRVPDVHAVAAALKVTPAVARALRVVSFTVTPGVAYNFAQGVSSVMKPLLETLGAVRKSAKKVMAAAKQAAMLAATALREGTAQDVPAVTAQRDAAAANAKTADALQKAVKVVMNSVYGGCAARKSRLFSLPQLAQTTTAYGRHMIQRAQQCAIHEYGCSMVYGDTDSIMVLLPDAAYAGCVTHEDTIRAAFAYTTCAQLPDGRQGMEARLTAVSGVLMEMEAISAVALFTDVKKRYAMRIFETLEEFEDNPDGGSMKMRGNEAVRRDTSPITRRVTREVYRTLLSRPDFGTVQEALQVFEDGVAPLRRVDTTRLEDLVLTGELKGSYGDTTTVPPQLAVSWAKMRVLEGYEPHSGDRVQFVKCTQPDSTRLVPPPATAAARYEELVLKKPTTQAGIQNAVRNNRKRPPATDETAAAEHARRRSKLARGQQGTLTFLRRGPPKTPVDLAHAAMRAVAEREGLPYDYTEARKLWPKDGAASAYYKAPSEIKDASVVDRGHYVQRVFGAVLQAFDNAVPPGTPLTKLRGSREAYLKSMGVLKNAPVSGAPEPAVAAHRIAASAWGAVHGTGVVQNTLAL